MVTQLLFGEHFKILEEKKSWVLIQTIYDDYECWIDKKQFHPLANIKDLGDSSSAISTDLVQLASQRGENDGIYIPLLLGSTLPKFLDKSFFLGNIQYSFEGNAVFPFSKSKNSLTIKECALWYLNTPYLWGGRSPFGIDCSGFTQMVFKFCGMKLKRDAWQQAEQGIPLNFFEEAKEGDLAFFDNDDGKIVHVGILLNERRIIHASGKVRIDNIDHHGIYNREIKKYTHRLRIIKRIECVTKKGQL